MFQLDELVNNLIANSYLYNLKKYRRKIPKDLTISSILNYIQENNLYESFVEKDYHSDGDYTSPIFFNSKWR